MKQDILHYVKLYSPEGPKIWFTHKANKKTYLLLSNLHSAEENSNGSGKDGIVAIPYDKEGNRTYRSCFILLDKIKTIWREPDMSDLATFELPDYCVNENEHPLS